MLSVSRSLGARFWFCSALTLGWRGLALSFLMLPLLSNNLCGAAEKNFAINKQNIELQTVEVTTEESPKSSSSFLCAAQRANSQIKDA